MQSFTIPSIKDGKPGPPSLDTSSDPALGSRKRTFDDQIKDGLEQPAEFALSKCASDGSIVQKWCVVEGVNPKPWCTVDHAATENMGYW